MIMNSFEFRKLANPLVNLSMNVIVIHGVILPGGLNPENISN